MKRFCVRCGKETDDLIDSLCSECYIATHNVILIPKEIVLDFDWRSGKVRFGRNWLANNDETFKEIVAANIEALAKPKRFRIESLEVSIEHTNEEAVAFVSFFTYIGDFKLPIKAQINISLRKTISDASMKISAYYHEAIIQLRFNGKPALEQVREKLRETLDLIKEQKKKIELSHAIDTKNVRGGVDILVGSSKATKIVTTKLGRKYKIRPIYSNKLLGLDDNGSPKYRHTYCLKFDLPKNG